MPPTPKPAATRQRRNKTVTSARLSADHKVRAPKLPLINPWCETHGRRQADCKLDPRIAELMPCKITHWHPQTAAWWKDIWASPMAPEFLKADVHGLFNLAMLEDDFWRAGSVKERRELAAEIRLQRQCFGLSPIDRRRLQWEVERTEQARAKRRPPAPKAPVAADDPRLMLLEGGKSKSA